VTDAPDLPPSQPRRWLAGGGGLIAPGLALAGLVVAAALSLVLLLGRFDLGLGTKPGGGGGGRTPNPSVVITPAPSPEAKPPFQGEILFAQAGDIWSISGTAVQQLSQTGHDAMPAWIPDGSSIVLVETRQQTSRLVCRTDLSSYQLDYPVLVRMAADGSGREDLESGLIHEGSGDRYFFRWLLQPDVSPDGRTIAIVSDAQDPCRRTTVVSHVTLATVALAGGDVKSLGVADDFPQGHDDPQWSPDGRRIAFTYNARFGSVGAPKIGLLTVNGRGLHILISGGYAQPSWSPDMAFVAAVRTTGSGRDIVIVRVQDGAVVARLTADGQSFAPIWAPDGSGIAYLKLTDAGVDLHLLQFATGAAAGAVPTLSGDVALTSDAIIDPTSRPAWFIPSAPPSP
jgi:Tol biopolymer transport system component